MTTRVYIEGSVYTAGYGPRLEAGQISVAPVAALSAAVPKLATSAVACGPGASLPLSAHLH
jgi:hypothetical protein